MYDVTAIEAQIAASEAMVPGLRPDCQKQFLWAQDAGTKTPVAILYIHGFSASPNELRPVPDLVAKELGANVFFTRLTGHGQDGAAMAGATLEQWQQDVAEAFEVAHTIGDEVIVIGCSTGCTLATLALSQGAQAKAVVHASPNFGLRNVFAQALLDMPGVKHWGHIVAGRTRDFSPINEGHAAYWTTSYPTQALYPMADAVRAAMAADLSKITAPALFVINNADNVVSPNRARKVMKRWGAPTTEHVVMPGDGDDENGHVMAGDVFSPNQTKPLVQRICAWVETL